MHDAAEESLKSETAKDLVVHGAELDALRLVVRHALWSLAAGLAYLIDEPDGARWLAANGDITSDVAPSDPRWLLLEVSAEAELTGRKVGGLHESLLDTDPAGSEGEGWV
jgi:hypothetical protein